MDKMRTFFESKWAVLLAFVPVVNLFYAVFALLLRGTDRFFFHAVNFFVACIAVLAFRFFPGCGWLIGYATWTALTLVDLKSIRQSDYTFAKPYWLRLAVLALPLLLLLAIILESFHLSPFGIFAPSEKDAFLEEQTRAVLETVINNDPQGYKELEYQVDVFPGLDGYTLTALRQTLMEKDSLPQGEIGSLTLLRETASGPRSCLTYALTYEAAIGDGLYRVAVEYTQTPDVAGFSRVDITKIG